MIMMVRAVLTIFVISIWCAGGAVSVLFARSLWCCRLFALRYLIHLDVQNAEEHDRDSATPEGAHDRARGGGVSGTDGGCASGALR